MTTPSGKVTCDLSISVDGYSAGLNQTQERPRRIQNRVGFEHVIRNDGAIVSDKHFLEQSTEDESRTGVKMSTARVR